MTSEAHKYEWKGINLEDMRQVMDEKADAAVKSVFDSGKKMEHFVGDLKKMASNGDYVHSDVPEPMHKFVQDNLKIKFTDEDIKNFKLTHEIWKKNGMKFVYILFFRALPYTYMAEKPANVLKMTKLLVTHTQRRIFETAQFVFDVMDDEWWTAKKRGILTALKVRIMHAAMRHVILNSKSDETDIVTGKWQSEWGKPISQEDLVATNQVFSLEFFKGMEMLGEPLSAEEQEAWFHTWKTIGRIMGVQDNLIAKDVAEAWSLQHEIYAHLFKDKTEAGIPLAEALVETMKAFHLPKKLTLLMMKHMLADEQFPHCFDRMLGPTYEKLEPFTKLFEIHDTEEKKHTHKVELNGHFHEELNDYYDKLHEHKTVYRKEKPHKGWFQKVTDWFMKLFGVPTEKQHILDKHISLLHNVLHHPNKGNPREELEEDLILDSMNAMGGIMISILNKHYRKGKVKNSGFRIPETLKDNWDLKG